MCATVVVKTCPLLFQKISFVSECIAFDRVLVTKRLECVKVHVTSTNLFFIALNIVL
jgi:hypothetical protein